MAAAALCMRPVPNQELLGSASFTELAALGKKRPQHSFGSIDDYEELEKLGEGAFGIVFKALDHRTGKEVAVKCVRGAGADGHHDASDIRAIIREVDCLAECDGHPSIVQIVDVAADAATGDVFLVMEFVGPSLWEHQHKFRSPFSEDETRAMMWQLLRGARKMHGAGVIHRDIKPDNVLVSPSGDLKICDFGLATMLRPAGTTYDEGRIGTMTHNSPEQLMGSRCYGTAVDMWALGCVMAELLLGRSLFDVHTMEDLIAEVLSLRHLLRDHGLEAFNLLRIWELSPAGHEVLAGLLAFDPEDRLTAEAALQHRWFTEHLDLSLCPPEEINPKGDVIWLW